jgi:hypothetical protein
MKWEIIGADRQTGEDLVVVTDAPDEKAARNAVKDKLLIESVKLAGNDAGPFVPSPPAKKRRPASANGCTVVAAILHIVGWLAILNGWLSSDRRIDRFLDDNAVGATANALEEMARSGHQYNVLIFGALMVIAALLCQLVGHAILLRNAINEQKGN